MNERGTGEGLEGKLERKDEALALSEEDPDCEKQAMGDLCQSGPIVR